MAAADARHAGRRHGTLERMPPEPGDILDLTIDTLAYGGRGVARHEGFVVFVRGAVPGDRVSVRVTKRKSGYAEARLLDLLAASPVRVDPVCGRHGECGGCEWQTISYAAQLQYKQAQVVESLQHIGGLIAVGDGDTDGYVLQPIAGMDEPWRYRNKMEFSFGTDEQGRPLLGLHRRGSWREVVEVSDCRLAPHPINLARQAVADACRALGLRSRDRATQRGLLRHLVVRSGFSSGDLLVNLFVSRRFPEEDALLERVLASCPVTGFAVTVNDSPADAAVGGLATMLLGPPHLRETLAGVPLRVPVTAFLQTNPRMCDVLYRTALGFAAPDRDGSAYDLYCGIGALSLALAGSASRVDAVEVVPEAIEAARVNADINGVTNVVFHVGDVRAVLKQPPCAATPAVIVADPPRAGMSRKALARMAALGAERIVYVSCNPTTLAGNARELAEAGYRLARVAPVDMFPQTHHIETVALFSRA
jgi:23S rRNA (uracil1939-C5)-methyltransferase